MPSTSACLIFRVSLGAAVMTISQVFRLYVTVSHSLLTVDSVPADSSLHSLDCAPDGSIEMARRSAPLMVFVSPSACRNTFRGNPLLSENTISPQEENITSAKTSRAQAEKIRFRAVISLNTFIVIVMSNTMSLSEERMEVAALPKPSTPPYSLSQSRIVICPDVLRCQSCYPIPFHRLSGVSSCLAY